MTQESWNQFVLAHGPRSGRFLQSWEWGEFQKALGERVQREVVEENGEVIGAAQWLDRRLPGLGWYRFCPKGPVGKFQIPRRSRARLRLADSPAKPGQAPPGKFQMSYTFLRIEPEREELTRGARKSIDINPSTTRISDLSKSEEELLSLMHPKTRYNIRLAQKHGVEVNLECHDLEQVWHLFQQTSARGEFRLHAKSYYKKMIDHFGGGAGRAFLSTASHKGDMLAANIMIDFGDTRTYVHGASSNTHRNLMGPYLLHWELLRDAQARGLRCYDWWGVAPPESPPPARGGASARGGSAFGGRGGGSTHHWSGISRFKRGYPGEEYASPGTYDIVLQPVAYQLYRASRSFVRLIRRYA